jgi:phosphate-selective porin
MFLRSPDNAFIFFPNGRLQTDGYFYKSGVPTPKNSFLIKRARLELAGWVDNVVYFQIGADFASGAPATGQTNLNATDDFVAIAPWGDLAILQFGQYDAPFTLENRTSDKYFDFMERSITVRAFGIPTNKEQGFMLHGTNADRNFYYSGAVLNGDGQNFKNLDDNFDLMARAWLAPLSFMGAGPLHDITVGGSYWTGNHTFGSNALGNQTTAGGFKILDTSMPKLGMDTLSSATQQGRQHSYALEVNAPIDHKFGVRWEYVHKDQPLSAIDTTIGPTAIAAGLHLKGWSTYGEAWAWVLGDDRIIGEPGMQMPTRYKKFGVKPPQHGLMLAFRYEYLKEDFTSDDPANPIVAAKPTSLGQTKVNVYQLGANYWISKRFRATFNWTLYHFGGTAPYVTTGTLKNDKNEQEFAFRLAIAL